ncbi:MAG: M20 family peptidase [Novosphingobium sp.]|uniref:M20 family peptidase n=1 Tax=Novosphingobium sp. TaxID=1874826 RepID=UPI003C7A3699
MKKWVLALGVGIAALAGTVAARTAMFKPDSVGDGAGITVTAAPAFNTQAAAQHLSQAVQIQTVSHQDPAENQTGEWTKLHVWLASTYPKASAAMQREELGQTLIYTWPGSDAAAQPIIVMAHQDVVPVTPGTEKDWKHAPFSGEIAEGAVWGRGSVDDKGSLVALFEALEALAGQGFKPKRTIILVTGHDEEAGGTGAEAAAQALAARKVKALFTIDEGGLIATDTPMIGGPAAMIGIAEKGYATLKVTANAPGGHSSAPPAPNEIGTVNLAKAVLAINAKQFPMELRGPAEGMVSVLAAKAGGTSKMAVANRWLFGGMVTGKMAASSASAAMLHTTIAPTMLTGSPKENVLPQTATALINYRIAPWNTSQQVLDRAREATKGLPVQVGWTDRKPGEPSPVSSSNSLGWNLIAATTLAGRPGLVVSPYLVVAGTDSKHMSGVSDDVYRFQAIALASTDIKMIHGTNEHMTLDNLESLIRFYARLIATAAG